MAINYTLARSRRAKYMRLTVRPGGVVILTVPWGISKSVSAQFIERHRGWIERAVARMQKFLPLPVYGRRAYLRHKEEARHFIEERVRFWAAIYKISYKRIAIRNTKARWGSCSREGNLNFSYAILFLPRELADYCVVHELCHIKEHNHSSRFWALVEAGVPNYLERRHALKRYAL